jgi:predicted NBD/HSP70 family sugar kinase
VLHLLLQHIEEGATQAEIAEATGLSRPSVGTILNTFKPILLEPAAEERSAGEQRKRGRLGNAYRLDPKAAWVVAIDIGRNHIFVGVADLHGGGGNIRRKVEPSPRFEIRRSPLLTLELTADILNVILAESPDLELANLAGIVVGLPGPIRENHPRDRVLAWGDHDVAEALREALRSSGPHWRTHTSRLKMVVDNDANLSALAERFWGAGRDSDNIFYVKWSTGLGGGVILDGEVRRGAGGGAGEFGHTPLPLDLREGVEECAACQQPCFEAAIGFRYLLESRQWSYEDVQKVARNPSHPDYPGLQAWIEEKAEILGLALVPVVNTLNPELLIVDGIMDQQTEPLFIRQIRRSLEKHGAMASARSDLKIRGGHFTVSAAARGGLALAFQQMVPRFLLQKSGS